MRLLGLAAATAAVLLVGCSKPASTNSTYSDEKTSAELIKPPPPRGAPKDDAAPGGNAPAPVAPPPTVPMLAYAYAYAMEVPPQRLPALVARHQAACAAAGPAVCQVTGSTLERQGRDQVHATLALRAAPAWLAAFRNGLAKDAEGAGGRVTQANVTSEDLSRQVTDVQAEIRAKTSLRDRLQAILDSRPAKVADLLQVETELAKVQGELDATQSEMAMMRQRLDSSVLTIDYQASGVLAPDSAWTPLSYAIRQFASTFSSALALLITAIAALLPWALAIGAVLWLFRKRLSRARPSSQRPPPPVPGTNT